MKIKSFLSKDKLIIVVAFIALGLSGLFLGMNLPKINSKIQETIAAKKAEKEKAQLQRLAEMVLPKDGFSLSFSWGDMGPKLIKLGVIDSAKFEQALTLSDEQKEVLEKGKDGPVKIDGANGQFVVDMLWALGLAQKSIVYDQGPLGTQYKSQQGNFASTGGWSLAKGDAVAYLNKFDLIPLTDEQQQRVGEIAKNVYRPCCGNSTWFPDCNHGMAALAAIELMVSQNLPDDEIYRNVLRLNSFWFPDTYLTAAVYFSRQGTDWDKVDAKTVLGQDYSSYSGATDIAKKVGPLPFNEVIGGSCGA